MKPRYKQRYKQQGAAQLAFVLVMLMILSIVGIAASKSSIIETHMANNIVETKKALIAANSAANYAWNQSRTTFDAEAFVENCEQAGVFDLRASAATSCTVGKQGTATAKTRAVWKTLKTPTDWLWNGHSQHQTMPDSLAVDVAFLNTSEQNNPMKLSSAPQYATGMYDPVLIKGSENYYCMPISIIGAGKGGIKSAQALVEIKAVPKSGCFRKTIQ
jgi:Tfp pilus assembly protein PilX